MDEPAAETSAAEYAQNIKQSKRIGRGPVGSQRNSISADTSEKTQDARIWYHRRAERN